MQVAAGWVEAYGLGLAVITLGPDGGAAIEPGGGIPGSAAIPTKVVDTVGAGDTFMAGFLDGWVNRRQSIQDLTAARCGRSVDRLLAPRREPADRSAEVDTLLTGVRLSPTPQALVGPVGAGPRYWAQGRPSTRRVRRMACRAAARASSR